MTQDWLALDLSAPLMAFGGVAIDQVGPVRDFPALSMVTGLFGNALGWDWSDRTGHQKLQDRIIMASAIAREGRRITDIQNAQLSKTDRGWTTRGQIEERAGASHAAPHRRLRDYHADREVVIVVRLEPALGDPALAVLRAALERPARPLFFGRKPCLPGRPILRPARIIADTAFAALQAVAETGDPALPQLPADARAQWTPGQGPEGNAMALADIRVWASGMHGGTRRVVEGRLGCEVRV